MTKLIVAFRNFANKPKSRGFHLMWREVLIGEGGMEAEVS